MNKKYFKKEKEDRKKKAKDSVNGFQQRSKIRRKDRRMFMMILLTWT